MTRSSRAGGDLPVDLSPYTNLPQESGQLTDTARNEALKMQATCLQRP